jgi:hypothetical protein
MKAIAVLLSAALALPGLALGANRHDAELALTAAGTALQAAERAGAAELAAPDLSNARSGLVKAQGLMERRDWSDSLLASEKTQADALLAEARSRQARAETATQEIDDAVQTLRSELGRGG